MSTLITSELIIFILTVVSMLKIYFHLFILSFLSVNIKIKTRNYEIKWGEENSRI
jgi:hypothetical protein